MVTPCVPQQGPLEGSRSVLVGAQCEASGRWALGCRECGGSKRSPLRLMQPHLGAKGTPLPGPGSSFLQTKRKVCSPPTLFLRPITRLSRDSPQQLPWAAWVNTAGQSPVTDDCSPKGKQNISAEGLCALVRPREIGLLTCWHLVVPLGSVCISLPHDALIQSWSSTSSPARNFPFMCRGVAGEITRDSVKCLAAFPWLPEAGNAVRMEMSGV